MMTPFKPNAQPTLGVEEEFHIVNRSDARLVTEVGFDDIHDLLSPRMQERICYELMPCVVENRSGPASNIEELMEMVKSGRLAIQDACSQLDTVMVAAGAYPGPDWRDQDFVDTPHYQWLKENYFYLGKRLTAFGVHVHVGVQSEEAAFYIMNEMKRWVYPLMAMTANSPFYDNFQTGMDSSRIHLFHSMPRTFFSPDFRTHEDLEKHYELMVEAGDILRPGDLWWMIRPQLPLGTVEYRICDLPTDVRVIGILTAVIQAATVYYQNAFHAGRQRTIFRDEYLHENRWRCCKDSLNATIVDPATSEVLSVKDQLRRFVELVRPTAETLVTESYLDHALELIEQGNEAAMQKELFTELGGNFSELVLELGRRSVLF